MAIVIDLYDNTAVRTDNVREAYKAVVLRHLDKGVILCGEDATEENVDELLGEHPAYDVLANACSEILVVEEEGSEGVAVGFSSADRESFSMPWPEALEEDDFLGNGDPTVFKTVGVAEGVTVKGETFVLPE